MDELKREIEKFQEARLKVYQGQQSQIQRDVNSVEQVSRDHIGRWFFELLQNCDDAHATEVSLHITEDMIYMADNGVGFQHSAVDSICGAYLSDKLSGTIGRKGIGFKAVYLITDNPQIFTINGEGLEFSSQHTQKWLKENNFPTTHIPYQWIPFYISRSDEEKKDSVLQKLHNFKTVIKLRIRPGKMEDALKQIQIPEHVILTFNHIVSVSIHSKNNNIENYKLSIPEGRNKETWKIIDSRKKDNATNWRVLKTNEPLPDNILLELNENERERIKKDGVSFIVAAPLGQNDIVNPTDDYLPLHVFYPTEEKSPVRLLLHAEFQVKSDRTEINPKINDSKFNRWIAEKLSNLIIEFVEKSYDKKDPHANISLLKPWDNRNSHDTTKSLWDIIKTYAQKELLLSDSSGAPCLRFKDASMLSVTVKFNEARQLLSETEYHKRLIHPSFDINNDAQKALKELEIQHFDNDTLINAILEYAPQIKDKHEWLWACWEWLAEWLDEKQWGDERKNAIEQIGQLPIIPVSCKLKSGNELNGYIVTWKKDLRTISIPDWLPLKYIDDWFCDLIINPFFNKKNKQNDPMYLLLEQQNIRKPDNKTISDALEKAIKDYWEKPSDDPSRFFDFIFNHSKDDIIEFEIFKDCPILARFDNKDKWVKANTAYFGHEWGNDILEELYKGIPSVAWAKPNTADKENEQRILSSLGVVSYPRILVLNKAVNKSDFPESYFERQIVELNKIHKQKNDHGGYIYDFSVSETNFDMIQIANLSEKQAVIVITLLSQNWNYYKKQKEDLATYRPGRCYKVRSELINSIWWDRVLHVLKPPLCNNHEPVELSRCWLPNHNTQNLIGELLPVINISQFGDNKEIVANWLKNEAKLRTDIGEITQDEWHIIIDKKLPSIAIDGKVDDAKSYKIKRWYSACLEQLQEMNNIPEGFLSKCRILCKRGEEWQYLNDQTNRYFLDEVELGEIFQKDVWLIDLKNDLKGAVKKYFSIDSLSSMVKKEYQIGEEFTDDTELAYESLNDVLPYVYVWRSQKIKEADREQLKEKLKNLSIKTVKSITVQYVLSEIKYQKECSFCVKAGDIYIAETQEPVIAQALAEVLGLKSEMEFYENLLRCNNDEERRKKLLQKNVSDEEISRRLREFSEFEESMYVAEPAKLDPAREPKTSIVSDSKLREKPTRLLLKPTLTSEIFESSQITKKPIQADTTPVHSDVRFKDPNTAQYKINNTPLYSIVQSGPHAYSGCSNGRTIDSRPVLSQEKKDDIERIGRDFAEKCLNDLGYIVRQMPPQHPGYDIEAQKDGETLIIEVKAHLKTATIIDITLPEIKKSQDPNWELWNIEHLDAEDLKEVTITSYKTIPEEALDARVFRLDLKKCSPK